MPDFSLSTDIGLKILRENPDLAVQRNKSGETALHALARKAYKIGSRSQLTIWEKNCPNMIGEYLIMQLIPGKKLVLVYN